MSLMSKLPLPEQDQDIAFSFWVDGKNDAKHSVAAFAVEEAVCSLTRVEVLLVSSSDGFDPEDLPGRKATLAVQNRQRVFPRCFSGIIVEVMSSFEDAGSVLTRVLLLPEFSKLENGRRYRIFQGMSVPGIVQAVFHEHDIADAVWQLTKNCPPRAFCMQYGESDFAFVQRILAEEGIFYYFSHRNEGCHQLVLCDTMQVLLDCPGQSRLDYDRPVSGQGSDIRCSSLIRSCRMGQGGAYARRHADLCGKSNSPHLVPGHAVTLSGHPDVSLNGRWYLTSVRHEGFHLGGRFSAYEAGNCFFLNRQLRLDVLVSSFLPATLKSPGLLEKLAQQSAVSPGYGGREAARGDMCGEIGYVCTFSALHGNRQYSVPERVKPVAAGPQKAKILAVDAADGQPPRCKVAFITGRNDNGRMDDMTCWVHVAPCWEVSLSPAMPAEGDDVIVDFLGGDPDQPVIIARGAGTGRGDRMAPAKTVPENGSRDQICLEKQPVTGSWSSQLMAVDAMKSVIYQKIAPGQGLAAHKPVIPLAAVQAAFSDENRNSRIDEQMQEWIEASRIIDVNRHQRENIKGTYELNCGEKYLCKTTWLNIDASQKLIIRGPGGKIIIDKSCITFEAPVIRLRGRLVIEEEAFVRHEGIKSAIRDELPLVAECMPNAHMDNGKS